MPDNSGAVDLSAAKQQEAPEQPEAGQPTSVLTAFAIIVSPDGNPQIASYEHEDIKVQHEPTPDMVFAACSTVLKDLQAQETAQAAAHMTASLLAQHAQQAQQQMQAQQMQAQLGNLRHG